MSKVGILLMYNQCHQLDTGCVAIKPLWFVKIDQTIQFSMNQICHEIYVAIAQITPNI
jgi:hypothetical protein